MTSTVEDRVRAVLDELRPYFHSDGGDVELVDVDLPRGIVRVVLIGACRGCPSSTATLQHGVLIRMQEAVPEIVEVVAVSSAAAASSTSRLVHQPFTSGANVPRP